MEGIGQQWCERWMLRPAAAFRAAPAGTHTSARNSRRGRAEFRPAPSRRSSLATSPSCRAPLTCLGRVWGSARKSASLRYETACGCASWRCGTAGPNSGVGGGVARKRDWKWGPEFDYARFASCMDSCTKPSLGGSRAGLAELGQIGSRIRFDRTGSGTLTSASPQKSSARNTNSWHHPCLERPFPAQFQSAPPRDFGPSKRNSRI